MLNSGTKLGRYEIRSHLGAGGMGEVYLARDTRLDRDVALKILPDEVAADPDRMRRFEQEAKAASGLNHPNIITIHEIDRSGSTFFIATEFIDGSTLRERLRAGPMPPGALVSSSVPTFRSRKWSRLLRRDMSTSCRIQVWRAASTLARRSGVIAGVDSPRLGVRRGPDIANR